MPYTTMVFILVKIFIFLAFSCIKSSVEKIHVKSVGGRMIIGEIRTSDC